MKNILILFSFLFIPLFSISQDFEIFYWTVEYRDSIGQDFKKSELEYTTAVVSFQDSVLFIKGVFSQWQPKYWIALGKSQERSFDGFSQTIAPLMDVSSKEAVIMSFITGPFNFGEKIVMIESKTKFEFVILYEKKRYVFLGIIE